MQAKKRTVPDAAGGKAAVFTRQLEYRTEEELDLVNVTEDVVRAVAESGLAQGTATVFVPGATGAVTCLEYEPGVIADFKAALERIAPRGLPYDHNVYQADGNGHSHVRAGLLGPSLTVPVIDGELNLGVWQSIVLVNFDNRRRNRRLTIQLVGF